MKWVAVVLAIGVAWGLHWCDIHNTPVIAPYMDQLSIWIWRTYPFLVHTKIELAWLTSVVLALLFFMVAAMVALICEFAINPSQRIARRVVKLRKNEEPSEYAE